MENIKIGPSGNGKAFYDAGYKSSTDAPKWLAGIGLNAYEYSFGRGFTASIDVCKKIGDNAKNYGVLCSVHAPYFINFANLDDFMVEKSYAYVLNSLKFLRAFGGSHCVFHPASQGKLTREEAVRLTSERLDTLVKLVYQNGYDDMFICPETMGKRAQIGTWKEVIDFCTKDKILIPCFDFGHINALEGGSLKTEDDYKRIFDYSFKKLGEYKTKNCHIHFSKIEYAQKGEIRHLDFDDNVFGPDFTPLAKVIKEYNLTPHIICESANNMSGDALIMKDLLNNL